jgi:hypothetical protein
MTNEVDIIQTFKKFADEQLHHHLRDIDTCYYNRELTTRVLEEEAYKKHRELYDKELEAKINSWLLKDDEMQQLHQLKDGYMLQLSIENFDKEI